MEYVKKGEMQACATGAPAEAAAEGCAICVGRQEVSPVSPNHAWPAETSGRGGIRAGTGVPGVPALSNSLSPCPNAKSGCNTRGVSVADQRVTAALRPPGRAINGPLGAVIRGLLRVVEVHLVCCSGCINRTDSANSQADGAGSIPVIRSTVIRSNAKAQVGSIFRTLGLH
jgi:hypothetical protein